MYTEEFEDNKKPIKKFIILFVIVLILIIILNMLSKDMTKEVVTNVENKDIVLYKNSTYKENLDHISDVMYGYFTRDKLKELKDKDFKMTVKELIDDGQLVSIVDNYDKVCDDENSYVELSKYNDKEYVLKIKLKCSKEDDYVLKRIGHYNYCSNYLCEKENVKVVDKKSKPNKVVKFSEEEKVNKKIKAKPKEVSPYVPVADTTKSFQYATTTGVKLNKWSNWSGWIKTSCDMPQENCDDRNPLCRRKIVLYNQDEKIGSYNHVYEYPRKELTQSTTSQIKGCNAYNYVVINGVTYATSTVYTTINSISSSTKSTQGSWIYKGEQTLDSVASDTATTVYKFVKMDFSACEETCEGKPIKFVYDVYEYTGTLQDTNTDPKGLLCNGAYTKTVASYQIADSSTKEKRKEPVYGKVCYYNMKTRKANRKGNTTTQFSTFNDVNLLNSGYYYTGLIK